MKLRMTGGAAAALALAGAAAYAQPNAAVEARYSAEYARCMDGEMTTSGMLDCGGREFTRQDRALNAAYQRALRELNARQRAKLQRAQRAWIAYRDARCASMGDEDWGTMSLLVMSSCNVQMTIERTLDLEDYPPG